MKIYHFTVIFVIFAVAFIIIRDVRYSEKSTENAEHIKMENIVRQATEAAALELRSSDLYFDIEMGQGVIDTFFYSIYGACGMMDDVTKRDEIKQSFGEYVISLKDEYYLYRNDWKETDLGIVRSFSCSGSFPYDEPHDTGFGVMYRGRFIDTSVTVGKIYHIDKNGLYHEQDCEEQEETEYILYSKSGCAKLGARPCRYCIDK